MRHRDCICAACFACCCLVIFLMPTGFEGATDTAVRHARARVLSVENSDFQRFTVVLAGTQFLQVELLSGPHQGRTIKAINQLMGKMELDEIHKPGDLVLIEYRDDSDEIVGYTRGHYRLHLELLLAALFAAALLAVAGWTGVKALLSFAFAGLLIWKVMIPLFLKGISPLPVALGITAGLTASVSFLVGGLNRRGLATFVGSFMGLLFTCALAHLFCHAFHIHGAVRPFAETLLYVGFSHLDLTGIFTCGIFIACSGAVMDLAMDIAASMDEIKRKKPSIALFELARSGLRVGRSVVGTMTTTLLLAYSGGYTTMLMYYQAQGIPLCQFFNVNRITSEILNIMVGSFGLVTVAPFTALAGSVLFCTRSTPRA